MQSLVKRPNYLLNIFEEKLLVSNACCILGKLPRFIQLVYIKLLFSSSELKKSPHKLNISTETSKCKGYFHPSI